jgi:DNA-binding transcriptional MerR regulator
MNSSLEKTFSIKTTARMVDMNTHTIRAWERRYKALDPNRNQDNNRREYNDKDIERLTLLAKLVKSGHQISHIAPLSTEILASMVASDSSATISEESQATKSTERLILERCMTALETYELILIQAELESARHFLAARTFLTSLAVPLLREVGVRVHNGTLSIAQEHALSSILRAQLMQTLFNVRNSIAVRAYTRKDQEHGLSICLATRDGDLHEFGILTAAILIAHHGHVPHYFGPNLPAVALADAAQAVHADVVLVGNTPSSEPFAERRQEAYARELLARIDGGTQLWWGGVNQIKDSQLLRAIAGMPTLESLESALMQQL